MKCSDLSYNWCYIEESIDLRIGEELKITNQNEYRNTERLETFSKSNMTEIPAVFFTSFPKLKHIRISSGHGITSINPSILKYARNLRVLNLIANSLKTIKKSTFVEAKNLKQINLQFNDIEDIDEYAFAGLDNLQILHLGYNRLKQLKRYVFAGAENIKELTINDNEISTIENGVFNMPHLTTLSLSQNKILTISKELFLKSPMLKNIDMSSNLITSISKSFFNLPKIDYVRLNHNNLSAVHLNSFAEIRNLRVLQLVNTSVRLSMQPNDDSFNNNQSELLSDLDILDLSDNEISDEDIFNRLTVFRKIRILILENNQLVRISSTINLLKQYPYLREIRLTGNDLDNRVVNELISIPNITIRYSTGETASKRC